MLLKLTDAECCVAMVKRLILLGMKEDKALHLVASSYCNIVSFKTLHKLYHKDIDQ